MDADTRRRLAQKVLDVIAATKPDDERFWYDVEYDAVCSIAIDYGVNVNYAYEAANELMCELEEKYADATA